MQQTKDISRKKLNTINQSSNNTLQNINQTIKADKQNKSNKYSNYHTYQLNLCIFWLYMLSGLLLSYQNFIFFLTQSQPLSLGFGLSSLTFSFIIQITVACKTTQTKWQILQLFIMLDNILIALVAAIVGYVGMMLTLFGTANGLAVFFIVIMSLCYFLFTGSFRILLAKCKLSKQQVIGAKICLILDSLAFLILAAYFLKTPMPQKQGSADPEQIKEFFFLYIFGFFTLLVELYSKITDLDGTTDLKYHYTTGEIQDEEIQGFVTNQNQQSKIFPQEN